MDDGVGLEPLATSLQGTVVLLVIWTMAFIGFSFLVVKSKSDLGWITIFLNVVAIVIFVFLSFDWISKQTGAEKRAVDDYIDNWRASLQIEYPESATINSCEDCPDIYYIIFDGYGRNDILREMYQYDNAEFLSFLEDKGFYVADESTTNYSQTIHSLSSSLNFSYINQLADYLGEDNQNVLPLRVMAEDNRIFAILGSLGYYTRGIPTGYLLTEKIGKDEISLPVGHIGPFQIQLLSITPLPVISDVLGIGNLYDLHGRRTVYGLDQIAERPDTSAPVFTFAHILIPHPPFVLDENGNPVDHAGYYILKDGSHFIGTNEAYRRGFRDQTIYVTRRMEEIVNKILSQRSRPVIIVIQSDHGPGSELVWEDLGESNLEERFSILNAYFFPDGDYQQLYPTISPVNSFRVILNQYFGADYDLLEDRNYFMGMYKPYYLQEVSARIR